VGGVKIPLQGRSILLWGKGREGALCGVNKGEKEGTERTRSKKLKEVIGLKVS